VGLDAFQGNGIGESRGYVIATHGPRLGGGEEFIVAAVGVAVEVHTIGMVVESRCRVVGMTGPPEEEGVNEVLSIVPVCDLWIRRRRAEADRDSLGDLSKELGALGQGGLLLLLKLFIAHSNVVEKLFSVVARRGELPSFQNG
jgi:hypothetical protein